MAFIDGYKVHISYNWSEHADDESESYSLLILSQLLSASV